jgi:hypothetical protein
LTTDCIARKSGAVDVGCRSIDIVTRRAMEHASHRAVPSPITGCVRPARRLDASGFDGSLSVLVEFPPHSDA